MGWVMMGALSVGMETLNGEMDPGECVRPGETPEDRGNGSMSINYYALSTVPKVQSLSP